MKDSDRPPFSTAVAQIFGDDGGVAGAGFLVGEGILVTCAHVVTAAGHGPESRVEVGFPQLPEASRVAGSVIAEQWRAPEGEDIAFVQLESIPAGAHELPLGSSVGGRGHRVASFGFPSQAPQGGHFGYGTVGNLLQGGDGVGRLLQLTGANDLTTGFSGGPVVDEVTGLVIGMVTSITSPDSHLKGLGIAYCTPMEVLRRARPQLIESQVRPYQGLEPFTEEQAEWFHGRDAAVESVLAALGGQQRLLLVLGPSGAGKSSLVRAGVLPALAAGRLPGSDRWLPLVARPGTDINAELERAGLPGAEADGLPAAAERRLSREPDHDRLLVILDQFEELLAQQSPKAHSSSGDRCAAATEQLLALCDGTVPVSVMLVMRDDFYSRLAAMAPKLLASAGSGVVNVPASLSAPELQAIITLPVLRAGARIEDGLPERIITDVLAAAPGQQAPVTLLPPLELALSQLWERRTDGRLTHQAYQRIGGVTGSLATWCDTALAQLPADQRPTARRLLTALVRPADEAHAIPATRQQVPLARLRDLARDPAADAVRADAVFDDVLAALTRHRIITTGSSTPQPGGATGDPAAELIHDALIRDWSDLRTWVAQDRRFQVWLHRAAEQAARHDDSGRPDDLLSGTALAEGAEWARQRPLPADVEGLLSASRRHEQAAARRTRRINTVLATLLVLALIATGTALWQRQEAVTAQHQAQSRELASQSATLLKTNPDLASLLAVQAHQLSPTEESTASLYKAAELRLRGRLSGHDEHFKTVAISPDGKTVAAGSVNDSPSRGGRDRSLVRLWDATTGKSRGAFTGQPASVTSLSFSPDGRSLASNRDEDAVVWDVASGKPHTILRGNRYSKVTSVAFSPDGKTLAIGTDTGRLKLWDTATESFRDSPAVWTGSSLTFSPDSETLAINNHIRGEVEIVDVDSGKTRHTLDWYTTADPGAAPAAFSPDGRSLAAGGEDGLVRLWNPATGKLQRTLRGHDDVVNAVAFSPDGEHLASAGIDRTVRLWDATSGKVQDTLTDRAGKVWALSFSPDSKTLASGSEDEKVRLWDVAIGTTRRTFKGHTRLVTSVDFSANGTFLNTNSTGDGTLRQWNLGRGRNRTTWLNLPGAATFSPDDRTLAVGSKDGISVFNSTTRDLRYRIKKRYLINVTFSPDGEVIAANDVYGNAYTWNMATGKPRKTYLNPNKSESDTVRALKFSPDGKMIAFGRDDGTIHIWEVATGKTHYTLKQHGRLSDLAFSPDGKTLATTNENDVQVWDTTTGKAQYTLAGHTGLVTSLAFSPNGKTLATGSEDTTAQLWDVATQKARYKLAGHADVVSSVSFSPNGKYLATGGQDATVRLWDTAIPNEAESIKQLCSTVRRNLSPQERTRYLGGEELAPVCPAYPTR